MHLFVKSSKVEEEGMMSFWKKLRGEEWEEEEVVEVRELNKEKVEMKEQMSWEKSHLKEMKWEKRVVL